MGKYPLTPSERARFDKIWNEMSSSKKATAVLDFDHFCQWLRGEDSSFYEKIKFKLKDLWEEIKTTIGEVAEGFAIGVGGIVLTPVVGIVEGLKEGSVEKGIEAIGELWKNLLK